MPDTGKPATGPLILEQITLIKQELRELNDRLARLESQAMQRHKVADERYQRTDQYVVNDAFNVDAVLKQAVSAIEALRATVNEENRMTRSALAAHLGDPGLESRERNGHEAL
jgi:hypothetical protein